MTDLVEKVMEACSAHCMSHRNARPCGWDGIYCPDCQDKSRAAIKAVADWLDAIDFSDTDLANSVARDLRSELERMSRE